MPKTVALVVVAIVGFMVAIDYISKGTLGEIEAGLPGGGHQKFAEYRVDPDNSFFSFWRDSSDDVVGEVSENPFAE